MSQSPAANGISIGLVVFAALTNVINKRTHRHTEAEHATPSVAVVRILSSACDAG